MNATNSLYRKPRTPGYLGNYNWRSILLGLLLIIATNIVTTQHIASHFDYQPALGPPLFQIASLRLYAPYKWFPWILRFGSSADPLVRQPLLTSTLIAAVGFASLALRCRRTQYSSQQEAHRGYRGSSRKRTVGHRTGSPQIRTRQSKARRLHRRLAG